MTRQQLSICIFLFIVDLSDSMQCHFLNAHASFLEILPKAKRRDKLNNAAY